MINIFYIIAIMGLISIILGTFMIASKIKVRRRYTYPLLILGGVCLEVYSIYIKDIIFIILQITFTIIAIYDYIKIILKN